MTAWTKTQLNELAGVGKVEIAPRHHDGRLGRPPPIWLVRVGADVLIRASTGPEGGWFLTANRSGQAPIHAAGVAYDVEVAAVADVDRVAIDAAYCAKYGRSSYVDDIVSDRAAATTLRLTPDHQEDP